MSLFYFTYTQHTYFVFCKPLIVFYRALRALWILRFLKINLLLLLIYYQKSCNTQYMVPASPNILKSRLKDNRCHDREMQKHPELILL